MELIKKKSILIISPSLIAESLSLKLTSLDKELNVELDSSINNYFPDLIIWNILNYQSEDLIRIELLKLKEKWNESKILIIFSENSSNKDISIPELDSEGILINPTAEKVLESINVIIKGGRVFDLDRKPSTKKNKKKRLSFNQRILLSGLKQIDFEINNIFKYVNNDKTPSLYKFVLKGRLRELITAKSLLIFIWGNSLDLYTESTFSDIYSEDKVDNTIFIKNKSAIEIWEIVYKRLVTKYSSQNFNIEFNNASIILSGIKKEYISRLICNMLTELDYLFKNIKENYKDLDYKNDFNSLIDELKKNTISRITDNYYRLKRNSNSISINEYLNSQINSFEEDTESHDAYMFVDPILRNEPIEYDGKLLPIYEKETFKILETIISNWVIRNCNLLASELFNICSNWPELRMILINPQLQSTRSFERFRNNINNYNRWHYYIYMPIYLYESKREYIDIVDNKFLRYFKDENREEDLRKLEWLQKQVTLLVEIRDALAPQIEIAIKYIGNIFVTLLTKVIGKAIGLIGKGIMQGLGRSTSK